MLKLIFGLVGAAILLVFLGSIIAKVREASLVAVVLVGVVMALVDLWQARNEADT